MTIPEVLTVDEVAELLRVSTRHVRRLMRENRIAYIPIGQRTRVVPAEEVERFLEREIVRVSELGGQYR